MAVENILSSVQAAFKNKDGSGAFTRANFQKVFDACENKANELGVGVSMCFMDAAGNPLMQYHMTNANLVSITLAPKKAWSALAMKQPTKEVSDQIQPGAPLYEMETMLDGKLVSFAGGIPLIVNDQIIGALGCSGGAVEEDQAICEAGVKQFLEGIN
ncbi:GlcG/HbpS family heme-binding protein [Furfurilactobacillus rossiae]|uniref:ATP cob(I)alamin adenosyltransferase n=1 Tax=Furfurilactobacillus rossiae DSM 15814 TaxID=1114972 RepID=A0A0R1RII6_9LACO|nr:heme-binding protein [Furfurilactobacillus rossiae]KRL56126.1 ATP cob(I)alamin adenosyltransferase [Furfurilactobacillus rossiae DSM 15814]MCF6166629.1 heme-binding protein [Furfurilactobacillus rossiae]QFR66152.1 heme-binding protein [Furfurilactobacillus rossiae]QLE61582.1 CobIalamin adenosyltransferase PduO [Furfurilactobacillus rossiae]QLE64377.1 CobIalamin adenosyltransferase PduO [Furfurilactobacillus rossiae]